MASSKWLGGPESGCVPKPDRSSLLPLGNGWKRDIQTTPGLLFNISLPPLSAQNALHTHTRAPQNLKALNIEHSVLPTGFQLSPGRGHPASKETAGVLMHRCWVARGSLIQHESAPLRSHATPYKAAGGSRWLHVLPRQRQAQARSCQRKPRAPMKRPIKEQARTLSYPNPCRKLQAPQPPI